MSRVFTVCERETRIAIKEGKRTVAYMQMAAGDEETATLFAAAPQLVEALQSLVDLYARPGENNVDRFERVAEMFYRETGCMAPGKDVSAASGDSMTDGERRERWEAWYAERAAKGRAALAAAGAA